MNTLIRCIVLLLSLLIVDPAFAQWSLTTPAGTGYAQLVYADLVDGEWNIWIEGQGQASITARLRCTSGTQPIRYIVVHSLRYQSMESSVFLIVEENGGTIPYIRTISYSPTSTGELWLGIVNISGVIGAPSTPHSGDVYADVIGVLQPSSINADIFVGPRLFSGASSITEIDITGNLNGDIVAPAGGVVEITADGNLGSSTNTIDITARDYVGSVLCDQAWANLSTTASSGGYIRRIETIAGGFKGSITTDHMNSVTGVTAAILIDGDLDADVTFKDHLTATNVTIAGTFPTGKTLKIGQGWGSGRTMTFESLAGQVILNSLDGSGSWAGTIKVGPTGSEVTLSPAPSYANLSANIGGGGVGLARFDLHDEDCLPPNGTTQTFYWTTSVVVRHYGPVQWAPGQQPVVVYYREAGDEEWLTLDQEYWTAAAGADLRDIAVTASTEEDFHPIYDYKIVPSAHLKCAGVTNNPAVTGWIYYLYGVP